jgi:type IV pilus assembly protein PilM
MIERLLDTARAAGLRPEGIDLAAFAMLRALGRTDAPVLHLAVGGVVNLAVARGGECLFTRVVPGGLEPMAIELAERRKLSVEHARALLRDADLAAPAPVVDRSALLGSAPEGVADAEGVLAPAAHREQPESGPTDEVVEARHVLVEGIRRIAGDVRNSLDFHQVEADAAVQRVVLTGPAAAISGFAEMLGERLGLPVEAVAVDAPGALAPERLTVAAGLAVEEASA